MESGFDIEVFFDGECPLCTREIAMLRRLDRRGRIRFTDIAGDEFQDTSLGIDMNALMARIHARLPDGSFIEGVEVFRRLYQAVGFGPLVTLSRAPGVSRLLDYAYDRFAENRLKWTGRCDDTCNVTHSSLASLRPS
jgi:predicted DCC family thiol-disulfide oxidoreductase YuxK